MSDIKIKTEDLSKAIGEILRGYGDVIYDLTEDGLDDAEKILLRNMEAGSPKREKNSKGFSKNWKGTGRKYKLVRFVGNTTLVQMKTANGKTRNIPLLNVLEYSKEHGRPFVKYVYDFSVDEMANAVVNSIKRGG